jgi:hypothetical protein
VTTVPAQVQLVDLRERNDARPLDGIASALLGASCLRSGALNPAPLQYPEGLTLFGLTVIHVSRARGEWLAARLLQVAEARLGIVETSPAARGWDLTNWALRSTSEPG